MAEIEAAANVGSFRGMNVHVGGSMGTQIPAYDGNKMSYLTGPLTVFFVNILPLIFIIIGCCRSCAKYLTIHHIPEDAKSLSAVPRIRYK